MCFGSRGGTNRQRGLFHRWAHLYMARGRPKLIVANGSRIRTLTIIVHVRIFGPGTYRPMSQLRAVVQYGSLQVFAFSKDSKSGLPDIARGRVTARCEGPIRPC